MNYVTVQYIMPAEILDDFVLDIVFSSKPSKAGDEEGWTELERNAKVVCTPLLSTNSDPARDGF